jgi:hypothetical protein
MPKSPEKPDKATTTANGPAGGYNKPTNIKTFQ